MKKNLLFILLAFFVMQANAQPKLQTAPTAASKNDNPFFQKWSTPYQTPPFNRIRNTHYLLAFKTCIQQATEDIEKIKNNPEEPTFKNTIIALDQAGYNLTRLCGVFFNIVECDATPDSNIKPSSQKFKINNIFYYVTSIHISVSKKIIS